MKLNQIIGISCTALIVLAATSFAKRSTHSTTTTHSNSYGYGRSVEGDDNMVTQTREVKPFTKIKTDIGIDMYVTVGSPQSVKITLDDNIIDFVETEVHGSTLTITANQSFSTHNQCRAEIVVPSIEAIKSEGSGDIELMGLKGDEFSYTQEGSGDFHANGIVDHFEVELSGSGNVDARDLKAHSARVQVDGSGDVDVFADESFEGTIDGSGDISYYGDPKHSTKSVNGSGRIRRR
jgi:hypothetical protein